MAFNGFMKMYLDAPNTDVLIAKTEMYGDWKTKINKILGKPRRFTISIHVYDKDGYKRGHTVAEFKGRGIDHQLSSAIFQAGNDFLNELVIEHGIHDVDLLNSYAVIRA